ncbi:MAG: hypothetical protein H6857_02095 [Rhodospirillales bacterium]|nr:hypothetical protein [Rhodospirillales bacterium]
MLNDITLCSRALIRIGAAPITSFSDGTAESEISGVLYESVRDALLSAYSWSFATTQAPLTQLVQAPVADYGYAFGLPNDFLRALSAGSNSKSRGVNFRIASGALHTNVSAVTLNYIALVDESTFPPYFAQALVSKLAAEFCIPITENTSRAEVLFRLAEREYENARQIDAQQDSPSAIESFPLTDIRG